MLDLMFYVLLCDASLRSAHCMQHRTAYQVGATNDITFYKTILKLFLITVPHMYSAFLWITIQS